MLSSPARGEESRDQAAMTDLEPIPYTNGPTALTGQLARPAGKPRAAIVVFPTIMNQAPNALRRLPMPGSPITLKR